MAIESIMKSEDAEKIVHFLAENENYGKKFAPYGIYKSLKEGGLTIYSTQINKILSMLVVAHKEIFGFEEISKNNYFWIKADVKPFKIWFKEWFGKDF